VALLTADHADKEIKMDFFICVICGESRHINVYLLAFFSKVFSYT